MSAPKDNQFWKLRSKHGRDKLFSTPELLLQASFEYFTWCDENPWNKNEAIKGGDLAGTIVQIPTVRPYTITGLCNYLCASDSWWRNFKKDASEDFLTVIEQIEQIIFTQKFEGAAVGAFNANIISRDLGLVDKKQQEVITEQPLFPDVQ